MQIADLIEQAILSNKVELWDRVQQEAISYRNDHPENPEAYYILGYIYFEMPRRTDKQSKLAADAFTLCLAKKPDHQLALYHISIIRFLEGHYPAALATLNKIHYDYFFAIAQPWRILKIEELKLACRLYLGEEVPLAKFEAFAKLCVTLLEDRAEVPSLLEISRCLNDMLDRKLLSKINEAPQKIIANLITSLGQQSIFSKKTGPFYDYLRRDGKL